MTIPSESLSSLISADKSVFTISVFARSESAGFSLKMSLMDMSSVEERGIFFSMQSLTMGSFRRLSPLIAGLDALYNTFPPASTSVSISRVIWSFPGCVAVPLRMSAFI